MAQDRPFVPAHPIAALRRYTDARIGLGRAGAGLPTTAHLDFAEAHARARDAVHAAFDADEMQRRLVEAGLASLHIESEAGDRATYLRRPDLGRRLAQDARRVLADIAKTGPFDLVVILGDGLSATATNAYAAALAPAIIRRLPETWRIAPIALASQARVALSDPVGEILGAKLALMLIGERPGLSAADSLGAYLTYRPRPGRTDAERNCVSNIRTGGLAPPLAAAKLAALVMRSHALQLSGTGLKDADEADLLAQETIHHTGAIDMKSGE